MKQIRTVKTAMTIAGSDSGGGAGIQADLKTFAALEVYGTCVLTAVTAQNTQGVYRILELPSDLVASQIDVILRDIGADSIKTGMLANSAIIKAVVKKIQEYSIKNVVNVVVDPVMNAKKGEALLQKSAIEALKEKLIPLSLVITLNTLELEALLGYKLAALEDAVSSKRIPLMGLKLGLKLKQELKQAAKEIYAMGAKNVVLKGGHLPISETAMDLLYDGKNFREFKAPRIPTSNISNISNIPNIHGAHGTGCTFASAIAAWLAKGANVERAVEEAKNYITSALKSAFPVGKGCSPVHHFYHFWQDPKG